MHTLQPKTIEKRLKKANPALMKDGSFLLLPRRQEIRIGQNFYKFYTKNFWGLKPFELKQIA